MQPIVQFMILIAVLGLVWFLIVRYIPMPLPVKVVLGAVAAIGLCVFLLNWIGFAAYVPLLITICVICLVWYLLITLVPGLTPTVKNIISGVAVVGICLVLLHSFGYMDALFTPTHRAGHR